MDERSEQGAADDAIDLIRAEHGPARSRASGVEAGLDSALPTTRVARLMVDRDHDECVATESVIDAIRESGNRRFPHITVGDRESFGGRDCFVQCRLDGGLEFDWA